MYENEIIILFWSIKYQSSMWFLDWYCRINFSCSVPVAKVRNLMSLNMSRRAELNGTMPYFRKWFWTELWPTKYWL